MKGTGVSPGISIGNAFVIRKSIVRASGISLTDENSKKKESDRFKNAVFASINEIKAIRVSKDLLLTPEDLEILDTQEEFLADPQIGSDVNDKIQIENKPAIDAVIEVIDNAAEMFQNMDDEYLRSRAADVRDIGSRILRNIQNNTPERHDYKENTIIVAEDISPSDTISLDIKKICGIVTQSGGKTSHAAILARAKGIPAVAGCSDALLNVNDDDIIILDGTTGEIIINPDQSAILIYKARQEEFMRQKLLLKSLKDLSATTKDGHKVTLSANISDWTDLENVFENGGDGVGLFRTEMLFMGRETLPSEEEQFEFYKQVALRSSNKPVICRTMDIGGDKQISCFDIPPENNPFLGYRAIRICLKEKDLFLSQLKAILRASSFGNLKIMFPMISGLDEVIQAKECVQLAKDELTATGKKFNTEIELGIMIEIPSAAMIADLLAKEVDFFSIGTNDLCQYTMAVDRMNSYVSELYDHFNPGLLRLIHYVIKQAHKYNRHVGMCGEMASDPLATLPLLGMGLDEFSMGAGSIPAIKNIIVGNTMKNAQEISANVLNMNNSDSIKRYLKEINK